MGYPRSQLTPEEMEQLISDMREGATEEIQLEARNRFIVEHISLVYYFVRHYYPQFIKVYGEAELLAAGMIGLIRAAQHYDPERGNFAACARWHIHGTLRDFLWGCSLIKFGKSSQTRRALRYCYPNGIPLDDAPKKIKTNYNLALISGMLRAPLNLFSSETGEEIRHSETGDPLATVEEREMQQRYAKTFDALFSYKGRGQFTDAEKYVIRNRLLTQEPVTLEEIGKVLGVTRQRVQQIEVRGMQKIRLMLRKQGVFSIDDLA